MIGALAFVGVGVGVGVGVDAFCTFANMKDRHFKTTTQRDYALDMLVTDCDSGAEYTPWWACT
ncbi:hypothetical protein [Xanthomonas hortorum]|uniref:hypothetical protein n=1 Tax=Xanthomonas hortorum TaxID=56454 RepID=UPI0009383B68|nr:hypothetical protein [Xanthomonas hortorum]APP82937.1 hypothetical protein BI317_00740 [Xanthomonas hortorum pv. gardneri]MCE4304194.1 hypothetical protein [Xanthomonas hortorum pv. vitians]MCE4309161.1 hypothetical protein [Xanthomonas hortorum pv. vitians]MCE4511468.1 hypothetical protein [Xanthomonas hortorum pv. vitians]MCE4516410.1 hypothetical protein [Xanthomonas hortorum pv. vitians]